MWQDVIDLITDWIEEFRLFVLSYWSHFYLLRSELSTENVLHFLTSCLSQPWTIIKRQSFWVQLALVIAVVLVVACLIIKIYVLNTKVKCSSKARLDGYTVLVTGANNGIGLETARDLASRGARIILASRNMERGVAAAKDIIASTKNYQVLVKKLDLASLQSVRHFSSDILQSEHRLDVLVLNAGLALTQKYLTEDNLEVHMATNHLGHFLLTNLLMPLLVKTANLRKANGFSPSESAKGPIRIVIVSSVAHWWGNIQLDNLNSEKSYESSRIYGTTKLANILFCKELSRRLKAKDYNNIIVNSLHPGAVQTGLFRNIAYFGGIIKWVVGLLYFTPEEGAQTSIYLSVSEDVKTSGGYYANCRLSESSPQSKDPVLAEQLWTRSAELVQLESDETFL